MNNSMKSVLISGLLSSFVITSANAAELTDRGVKLGLNMASVSGTDAEPTGSTAGSKAGISIGGFSVWEFSDKFSVRPEVLYTQKGVTWDFAGTEVPLSLSYIDVPVMAQYAIPVSGLRVNLFGGPYMGILLSADSDGTDVKDTTTALDYGLQIGAGAVFQKRYSVDLRYSMGLASIDDSGADADMKNSGILVSGGYSF